MMSPATIREISAKAAAKAARAHKQPFIVEQEDIDTWKAELAEGRKITLPFPHLGDYVPKGWYVISRIFSDMTGEGLESEPARTLKRLVGELIPGRGYGIGEVGQFQCYVLEFERDAG
jgi:hypothetical protein